jgi:maltose O-acetyltransferase
MPFDLHTVARTVAKRFGDALTARSLRAVDRLGSNVTLFGAPHIENLGRIEIGEDVAISSVPVQSHLVAGPGATLRLGARVTIGSGAAIAAHRSVEIEDDAHLGDGVVIMDTDFHDTKDHAAAGAAEPVVVGAGARIGDRVTVLKGSRIGRGARVASDSVVAGEIPDGATAAGSPARVTRREAGLANGAGGRSPSRADVPERVAAVVAATFHVPSVSLDDGPFTIRGWDSLGSLRLLVALEDAFGMVLPEAMLPQAKTVGAIAEQIAALLSETTG